MYPITFREYEIYIWNILFEDELDNSYATMIYEKYNNGHEPPMAISYDLNNRLVSLPQEVLAWLTEIFSYSKLKFNNQK